MQPCLSDVEWEQTALWRSPIHVIFLIALKVTDL